MDLLIRIQHLILLGNYRFSEKADSERVRDGLGVEDVLEAIMKAGSLRTKRSRSANRHYSTERIHIIQGFTHDGILVYTKGVIRKIGDSEFFYLLVSAKRSTWE